MGGRQPAVCRGLYQTDVGKIRQKVGVGRKDETTILPYFDVRFLFAGADAIEMAQRAEEELPVGNGGRGAAAFVELVAADQPELVAALKDKRRPVIVGEIEKLTG